MKLFGRLRRTVVQNGQPVEGTADAADTASLPQDPVQNYDAGWPQNGVLCRIDGAAMSSLIFLACGRRMASISQQDNKVRLWSMDSVRFEELLPPLEHDGSVVNALAASRDGKWIASGDDEGMVVVWDAKAHPVKKVGKFKAAEGDRRKITALDISPDSSRVAVGSGDGTVTLWRIEARERILNPLQHWNLSSVSSVKFSPAGGRIASGHLAVGGCDRSIQLWHSHTGARLESINNPHTTYSLTWSIDGHLLFAGGPGGSIRCFDVVTRNALELKAPSVRDLIDFLCVSNSGQFLVSVSSGRSYATDIWNIATPPYELLRSRDEVLMAAVSPNDTVFITVEKGSEIASWDLSTLIPKTYLFHRFSLSGVQSEPFTYVSNAVLEAWKSGNLDQADEKLGKEIEHEDEDKPPLDSFARVNRAILRVRRGRWDDALKDVQAIMGKPNDDRMNLIAHVAEGLARRGQGKRGEAIDAFKIALCDCDRDVEELFKCVKSIMLLNPDEVHCETDIDSELPNGDLRLLVEARKYFLFIREYHSTDAKDYERVLALSEAVPDLAPLLHLPEVKILSLMFNWDLHDLIYEIHELRCRALFGTRRSPQHGAVNYFLGAKRADDLSEELESIRAKLSVISEESGDEVSFQERYDEAIAWYSEALALTGCPLDIANMGSDLAISELADKVEISRYLTPLSRCPQCIAHLFAKRSEAKAKMKSWTGAFADAAWSIENGPTFPWGYERKFMALHAQGRFREAVNTLKDMSSKFMDTHGPEIYQMHSYTKTINEINDHIHGIFDKSPFVLINVEDGRLYNQEKQRSMFEQDMIYYTLVSESSVTAIPDINHIKEVVEGYFSYVMFSHTWEGEEPSFEMVSKTSVYQLDPSPLVLKLQKFCETVRGDYKPHRWSWSDTCCIDKTNRDVFEKSIRFMYKWYHHSALTLVLLAHPSKSKPPNSPYLRHNRWMFRVWTLQELLAPKILRFYNRNWELYVDGGDFNHKTLPELQGAMTGVEDTLRDDFSPAALTVRERLCLASTRNATIKVDIAYALIGIFSSDINVDYTREGNVALGLLLQEVVNRQGDITVLDWIGVPSTFNSSVPAELSVYEPGSYKPYELPPITDDMVDQRQARMCDASLEEEATGLHALLSTLGLPRFADRRLSLPCITFSVTEIKRDTSSSVCDEGTTTYFTLTSALGEVKFKTKDVSFSKPPSGRVVLVYPWIRDLLVQTRGRVRGGKHVKHIRGLRLVTHLEQGFRALLFAEQSDQQYRRLATDEEILVRAGELTSLEDVGVEVLEIWERS